MRAHMFSETGWRRSAKSMHPVFCTREAVMCVASWCERLVLENDLGPSQKRLDVPVLATNVRLRQVRPNKS